MKKVAKITDVAAMAGVAKSTVSNVLTGRKFVSEELRKKVLDACNELDFHPDFYASGLSSRKSNIIAFLIESTEDVDRHFYRQLIVSCLKEVSRFGYSLLLYYNSDREKLINTLRQGMAPIDGALLMSPFLHDERLKHMESERVSCVVVGRPGESHNINYVDVDNRNMVKTVTESLVGAYGKDIYLINSDSRMTISQDRAAGFGEACARYGIDLSGRIFESVYGTKADGENFALEVLKKDTVIITANGLVASGVYAAAAAKGLEIGRDVGVFALGTSLPSDAFTPSLSYADQNYDVVGRRAVQLLISEIENGYKKESVILESRVVHNASTSRIQKNG